MHQRKECLLNKQTRKIEPVVLDSMLLLANEAQNLKKLYDVLMVQSILAIGCGASFSDWYTRENTSIPSWSTFPPWLSEFWFCAQPGTFK